MERELLLKKIEETEIEATDYQLFYDAIECAQSTGRNNVSPLRDYLNLVLTCEELAELQQVLLNEYGGRSIDRLELLEEYSDVFYCVKLIEKVLKIEISNYDIFNMKHNMILPNKDDNNIAICMELSKLQQLLTKLIRGKDVIDSVKTSIIRVKIVLGLLDDKYGISKDDVFKKIQKIKCKRCIERSKKNIL